MTITPITLWSRKNERGVFEHNHLEDGHAVCQMPAPKHPTHIRAWAGGEWRKTHALLDAGVVKPLVDA